MAWLWDSWEEFTRSVRPVEARPGWFVQSKLGTRFEAEKYVLEAVNEIEQSLAALERFNAGTRRSRGTGDLPGIEEPRDSVILATNAGERLLLYHKRLALSTFSYGFLHSHDLIDHWQRYAPERIPYEVRQFAEDLKELLRGYCELAESDGRFIVDDIDLPEELLPDFRSARDLFSTGFDEAALFFAGRGLEGVLRKIASDRKIDLVSNKGPSPASEADLYDLIEALSRVRWKVRNEPLISKEAKALLHYLRTSRNSGAHPNSTGFGIHSARESAQVVAKTADRLWNSVAKSRARLGPTKIQKNW